MANIPTELPSLDNLDRVDEAGVDSFPASDPPPWTLGVVPPAIQTRRSAERTGRVKSKNPTPASRADTSLTGKQLGLLRSQLEARRDELRRKSQAHLRAATRSDDALVEDGDVANRLTDIADSLGLAEHEQAMLSEVEHALSKFDAGTYGLSELSGELIPFARLEAVPWARAGADETERDERARR